MDKIINIFTKINHWSIVLLVFFLGVTGIMGCTIFSHDSIVSQLEFAYGINEIQSGKASQFFISKVIRGLMWDWHYVAGITLFALFAISWTFGFNRPSQDVIHPWHKLKKNPMPFIFFILFLVLLVTGTLRYYRGDIAFMGEGDKFIRNLPRHIHHYASWALLVVTIMHVSHVIYMNTKYINTLISDMFTSKKMHFGLTLLLLSSLSKPLHATEINHLPYLIITNKPEKLKEEKNYKEAMEFYNGKKGFWHEKKTFPNCPYDACEKNNDVVQSFEENGERYYNIKMHDFKSAKALFDKSVSEAKNPLAAEKNILMIMERLNYKSKYYESYLMDHIHTSLGIEGAEAIKKEVQKNLQYIDTNNSPMMLYKAGEVFEHGYFGVEKDVQKAKFFYKAATNDNTSQNMFSMLAKHKLNSL